MWISYPRGRVSNVSRGFGQLLQRESVRRNTKGGPMYISGGVLALIVVIALLIWLL
jgi:hypothetical protein